MQPFNYACAATVDEAVALLGLHNSDQSGGARVLSGGTDLLVALREGRLTAQLLVDVKRIPELVEMRYDPADGLTLGAATPCRRIHTDAQISAAYPGLIDAASIIGGVQVQGRASLGGNLCNASPAADSIPALIAHRATCVIAGPGGRRTMAVEEFCTGPGRTALQPGEFLVALHLPPPRAGSGGAYLRFIPRNEMDIAVVGVGVAVQLAEDRRTVEECRIALGAVAPTPLFVTEAGAALAGQPLSLETIGEAARIAQAAARPISDMRGAAEYRRHLVGVLTRRALTRAFERAKASEA